MQWLFQIVQLWQKSLHLKDIGKKGEKIDITAWRKKVTMIITKRKIGLGLMFIGVILVSIPFYYEWKQAKQVAALEEALAMVAESDENAVDLATIKDLPFSEEELKGVLE